MLELSEFSLQKLYNIYLISNNLKQSFKQRTYLYCELSGLVGSWCIIYSRFSIMQ